nr:30S ribosomal protein S2 [Spirochaetales bacterium]
GNDDAIRSISLFTQIIANAVVEAESETGLKIIETLQDEDGAEEEAKAAVEDEEEEVEVDPATYSAEPAASAASEVAAEGAAEEPIVEEDKYYEK